MSDLEREVLEAKGDARLAMLALKLVTHYNPDWKCGMLVRDLRNIELALEMLDKYFIRRDVDE